MHLRQEVEQVELVRFEHSVQPIEIPVGDLTQRTAAILRAGEDVVEKPLEEIYGPNYQDNVSGVTRNGSNNYPTGNPAGSAAPSTTNFEDGTMKGIYKSNPDGTYGTYTMYPNPASP